MTFRLLNFADQRTREQLARGQERKPMARYWRFRRTRLALLRWIRARNERKLKQALGWKSGWEHSQCR